METEEFIFTIFFLTLGPIKIIPAFANLTQAMELKFKRKLAIKGIAIATGICLYVFLLGRNLIEKYHISLEGIEIAGGLVLLISALNMIFPTAQSTKALESQSTALKLAITPVATPMIVPPVGVAAILIFVILAPRYPGRDIVIALALAQMLVLDFLVMFFIDAIMKVPGLLLLLNVFGKVLVFTQAALAIQVILVAFKSLGVIKGANP